MNTIIKMLSLTVLFSILAACTTPQLSTAQRNTAAGAIIGGVAGNLIGGNTESTLGGAALGGVIGSQINNTPNNNHYR